MASDLRAERDRFLTLFDRLAVSMTQMVELMPAERRDAVPIENASMRFGDRLTRVTAKNLFIHTIVAEHCWARDLGGCEDGAVIALPRDAALTQQLSNDDYLNKAKSIHSNNVAIFSQFDGDRLAKKISFNSSDWTVIGLLWGIYAHRAFHLGNIDIYVRQFGTEPLDFFNFVKPPMA